MAAPWTKEADAVVLCIHAQPGAKQSAFVGLHGDALKVRLAAPAQEGRANRELCRFLADAFGVPLARVELLAGDSARRKRVRITSPLRWPQDIPESGTGI